MLLIPLCSLNGPVKSWVKVSVPVPRSYLKRKATCFKFQHFLIVFFFFLHEVNPLDR